jgi:hypothetical protein
LEAALGAEQAASACDVLRRTFDCTTAEELTAVRSAGGAAATLPPLVAVPAAAGITFTRSRARAVKALEAAVRRAAASLRDMER